VTNEPDAAGAAVEDSPPAGASPEQVTDAWREAIVARRTRAPEGAAVPGAQARRPEGAASSRRSFIRTSFWSGLGLALLGTFAALGDFIYPRGADPIANPQGQFWLANLDSSNTRDSGPGGGVGLIALWRKCPHLGCTVPWKIDAAPPKGFTGTDWYQCPCHGSTYTRSGIRVFGPAPRSMDTMAIEIDDAGNITVQTGARTNGGPDNPERAVTHPRLPT